MKTKAPDNVTQHDLGRRHGPGFSWRPRYDTFETQIAPCQPKDIENYMRTVRRASDIERHRDRCMAASALARMVVNRDRLLDDIAKQRTRTPL